MANNHNKHDEVISALLKVLTPMNGEIRLIGRVSDPLLGNQSDKETFLFIPDLHLLSPSRQEHFGKYSFNHAGSGLLQKLLRQMARLKESWQQRGDHKLVTIQLGDFFDAWREFPGFTQAHIVPDNAHGRLRDILYRGIDRGKSCLKAVIILGNHDTDNGIPLAEVPFRFKAFNRARDRKPFLFATHGDAFSILETVLPEFIKEFAVNFIGKLTPVDKYWIGDWGKMAAKINKPVNEMEEAITEPEHSLDTVTGAPIVLPGKSLPSLLCETIAAPDDTESKYFKKIYDSIEYCAEKNLPGQHVKVAAIGHTHKASMVFCKPSHQGSGRPLALMDVGAWIENCRYPLEENGEITLEPSAQLGVMHGNDARIYQIRVPA